MMATAAAPKFVLFVSSVKGSLVRRYGTPVHIGVHVECVNPGEKPLLHRFKHRWREDEITALPEAEARRYAREYARAIREGALRPRTEAEWRKQNAALDKAASEQAAAKQQKAGGTNPKGKAGGRK